MPGIPRTGMCRRGKGSQLARGAVPLVLLGLVEGCISFGRTQNGACSRHDECAPGLYCVEKTCAEPCGGDMDCSDDRQCAVNSELPAGVRVCLIAPAAGGTGGESQGLPQSGGDGGVPASGGNDVASTGGETADARCEPAEPPPPVVCGDASGMGGGTDVENVVPHAYGHVNASDNDFGVRGMYYTYVDQFSTIEPRELNGIESGPICVTGTAARIENGLYGIYFGGGIGLILNEGENRCGGPRPYDATTQGITGFSFALSGESANRLQFKIKVAGEGYYCHPQSLHPGLNEIRLSEVILDCWNLVGSSVDPRALLEIQWNVGTNEVADHNFCFCLSDLAVLID